MNAKIRFIISIALMALLHVAYYTAGFELTVILGLTLIINAQLTLPKK